MKLISYHNGKEIPYWLGLLIGFDQFIGCLSPGADIDRTVSHRLGILKVKTAIKAGLIPDILAGIPKSELLIPPIFLAIHAPTLRKVKISFYRHPLAATLDWILDGLDPGHSLRSIGA